MGPFVVLGKVGFDELNVRTELPGDETWTTKREERDQSRFGEMRRRGDTPAIPLRTPNFLAS